MQLKRVVVTGLGAVTPLGNSVNDYWNNLINGVSGAGSQWLPGLSCPAPGKSQGYVAA